MIRWPGAEGFLHLDAGSAPLHLYFGLFVIPYVLVFAVSVFFLNHACLCLDRQQTTATIRDLNILAGIEQARGLERAQLVAQVLSEVGVVGEINFIRT